MKKKRLAAAAILLVALLGLYRGAAHLAQGNAANTANKHTSTSSTPIADQSTGSRLPTKASNRPANTSAHATHGPERLKDFFLPEVAIEGLPIEAALAKLRTAYEDVCRNSGEVPVRLTFVVPPEATQPLTVKTGLRTLDASIRLLAAMAGLKVERNGSEYAFTSPQETGEAVTKTFQVSPDFFSRPATPEVDPFAEGAPPARMSPAGYFASKGITLDPSTRFSFVGSTLKVNTTSAADLIAIAGMIDVTVNETPIQHKMRTVMIDIPAGSDWTPPDLLQLDEAGVTQMMRQLDNTKGVNVVVTPATVVGPGQSAKVEMTREAIMPSPTIEGEFQSDHVGVVAEARPVPYGFGHQVDLHFSEKVIDETGTEAAPLKIVERTSITDSSFSGDDKARVHIQPHPDGTRSVVLVTPTLIDATGRPLNGKE